MPEFCKEHPSIKTWSLSGFGNNLAAFHADGKISVNYCEFRSLTRNLGLREIYRLAKYPVDHLPHGITRCRELIAVAVAQIDCDPVIRDCLVHPALEIAVADVEKIIAQKQAARRYPVAHENAEDLAADFIIGRSVKHGAPAFRTRDQQEH